MMLIWKALALTGSVGIHFLAFFGAQGHQEFLEKSQGAQSGPWLRLGNKIKAVEICLVEDLKYTTFGGSGDSSCQITLKFIDTYSDVVGKTFKLTLPELLDFPDFIVERNRYDAAMKRSWTVNDTCVVWWRNEIEEGGAWYEGTIVSIKDKSCDFPGSPWESCVVRYTQTKDSQLHSPWELHDPDNPAEQPHSNFESAEEILYSFTGLLRAASRDKVFLLPFLIVLLVQIELLYEIETIFLLVLEL